MAREDAGSTVMFTLDSQLLHLCVHTNALHYGRPQTTGRVERPVVSTKNKRLW